MGSVRQYAMNVVQTLQGRGLSRIVRSKKTKEKLCTAIALRAEGFAVAEIKLEEDRPKVIQCHFVHNTNLKIRGELIAEMISRRKISTQNVVLVLDSADYRFLLADAPDVPVENLRYVMPNKIKDSLPWKVADTTIDVLVLPPDAFRGRKKNVYVAAVETDLVSHNVRMLRKAACDVVAVTTVEMALKSFWDIAMMSPKESIGILSLSGAGGIVLMMSEGAVYLTRKISVALDTLGNDGVDRQEIFDQIVLEIQRSVDFYESQLGKGTVTKLVMLPTTVDLGVGYDYIEQNISTDIDRLDPLSLYSHSHEMSARDQAFCMTALGAAVGGLKNV